jgi:hypothetical protein
MSQAHSLDDPAMPSPPPGAARVSMAGAPDRTQTACNKKSAMPQGEMMLKTCNGYLKLLWENALGSCPNHLLLTDTKYTQRLIRAWQRLDAHGYMLRRRMAKTLRRKQPKKNASIPMKNGRAFFV